MVGGDRPPAPSASLAGRTIARYAVEALIGRGGMGEVYRAVDPRLRRKVALKIIRPDRNRSDAVDGLFREARAAAALTHPNTVAIHDLGESDGLFYIVMELVNGMPLLAYVGDERVPLARKLRWCADIARALASATSVTPPATLELHGGVEAPAAATPLEPPPCARARETRASKRPDAIIEALEAECRNAGGRNAGGTLTEAAPLPAATLAAPPRTTPPAATVSAPHPAPIPTPTPRRTDGFQNAR